MTNFENNGPPKYGVQTPHFMPYEPFLLGVGVVSRAKLPDFCFFSKKRTKKDNSGRTSQDQETPSFETAPLAALDWSDRHNRTRSVSPKFTHRRLSSDFVRENSERAMVTDINLKTSFPKRLFLTSKVIFVFWFNLLKFGHF